MENRLRFRHYAKTFGVELHFQPHPSAAQACGATEGNHIFLNLQDDFFGSDRSLRLLRHEIHHVLQQRQGRVAVTGFERGYAVNTNYAMEVEAEESAMDRLAGDRTLAGLFATRGVTPSVPVLQYFTLVGDKAVHTPQALSPKGQHILRMIPTGESWLRHMGTSRERHLFAGEPELLLGILEGLHDTSTLVLPVLELNVSPHALYAMQPEELERILAVERKADDANVDAPLRTLLTNRKLWRESDLEIGESFLQQHGLPRRPGLAARSLADRIALFELVADANTASQLNPMLQREAAIFAAGLAQSIMEFIDFYRFFLALIQEEEPAARDAEKRLRRAAAVAEELTPALFHSLSSPQFDPAPTLEQMPSLLRAWSVQGQRLGFPRLSAALAHMAPLAGLENKTGDAVMEATNRSMDQLMEFLLETKPEFIRYTQSGSHLEYVYQKPDGNVTLQLARDGCLTIGSRA